MQRRKFSREYKLEAEHDILKKGRRLFCEGRDVKFAFVAKHRSIWPVAWLCEAMGVSRSGFHAWLHRSPSQHARYDKALLDKIKDSFRDGDRTYGARRVWHDLLAEGLSCGLHRVKHFMRENALRARPRRRGLPKDDGDDPDLLSCILDAPPRLAMEMADIIRFKTSTLTATGFQQNGVSED